MKKILTIAMLLIVILSILVFSNFAMAISTTNICGFTHSNSKVYLMEYDGDPGVFYTFLPNNKLVRMSKNTARQLYGKKIIEMKANDDYFLQCLTNAQDITSRKPFPGMLIKINRNIYYVSGANQLRLVTRAGIAANNLQNKYVIPFSSSVVRRYRRNAVISTGLAELTQSSAQIPQPSVPPVVTIPIPPTQQYSNEPALTFVFINGGYSQTEFDNLVKSSVATLANATPLKDCPQQIKTLKINNCSTEDLEISDYAKKYYDNFDTAVLLKPYNKTTNCRGVSSKNDSIILGADCEKAFVHEVGHALFNFSDQYCDNSSHNGLKLNPATDDKGCGYSPTKREYTCPLHGTCWNRVTKESDRLTGFMCYSNNDCVEKYNDSNYECVSCFVPKEGSWDYSYCSQYNNPPIYCLGNPNKNNNDRSVMGMAEYIDKTAFDPNEYSIIQSKFKCKIK